MVKSALAVARSAAPVREEVVRLVRAAIADGTLTAGSRLKEKDLVEFTGVSRTSVREAIRVLEVQGLIETIPGEGPRVATLSVPEAEELYNVRAVLESYAAAQFAVHATDADIDALRGTLTELGRAGDEEDRGTASDVVDRFYDLILEGSGNRFLRGFLEPLHARISILRALSLQDAGRKSASMDELLAIVAAISAHDPEAAGRLASEHALNAGKSALAIMRATAASVDAPLR